MKLVQNTNIIAPLELHDRIISTVLLTYKVKIHTSCSMGFPNTVFPVLDLVHSVEYSCNHYLKVTYEI